MIASPVFQITANMINIVATLYDRDGKVLTVSKVQTQLKTASSSLETLQGTRTRAIDRKLKDVEILESGESNEFLDVV